MPKEGVSFDNNYIVKLNISKLLIIIIYSRIWNIIKPKAWMRIENRLMFTSSGDANKQSTHHFWLCCSRNQNARISVLLTQRTPGAPPKIGENKIFWRKLVIFHKYMKLVACDTKFNNEWHLATYFLKLI
jgi:hypothetical protein